MLLDGCKIACLFLYVYICLIPLHWPLAYTTACTSVKAIISVCLQISETSCPNFVKFSVRVVVSRPSLTTAICYVFLHCESKNKTPNSSP